VTGSVREFVGIGLGPFNLGLACLTDPLDELDGVFLEARDELAWHPGMMLDDATLQVPFLADLVSMADPTSRFSFLNYLKETGNLYPFYIRESFYPLRREYDDYCRWAADRLPSVRFGRPVTRVEHDGTAYVVTTATGEVFRGRRLVLGTGTSPRVPECLDGIDGPALHSADYLRHKADLQRLESITIVGSGQSAAEIYQDLLVESPDHGYELTWLTRSPRFFPMEYTKLTLEMTSPEYTAYFQGLPELTRARLLREQRSLYKGISGDLVDEIFDLHYRLRVQGDGPRTTLVTNTAVTGGRWDGSAYELDLHHEETGERFGLRTQGLVLATGYAARVPAFLDGVRDRIAWDDQGRYVVSPTYTVDHAGREVFVQNAEEHSHGFVAPDLGMGAHRNSVLIATMLGREVYPVEKRVAVQSFGVPDHLRREVAR
jgi:lysine N6-hydroxylase